MVKVCNHARCSLASLLFVAVWSTINAAPFVGVNLGGWLLMEDWIFPEYFNGVQPRDEHGLISHMGGNTNPNVTAFMQHHWDTFLTEEELDNMHEFGITHVRIPVGYWIVDWKQEDGFVDGGLYYLNRSIAWLQRRGMKAILDLHALPGAQTPKQSFTACANCYSDGDNRMFWKEPYLKRGKEAMRRLAWLIRAYEEDPTTSNVVQGLELVNEPDDKKWKDVKSLYSDMVPFLRTILPVKYALYLSFMNEPEVSAGWMRQKINEDPQNWTNVVYDRHLYHAFTDDDVWQGDALKKTWSSQSTDSCKTCCRDRAFLAPLEGVPNIIGEWSLTVATLDSGEFKQNRFLQGYWADQLSLWANLNNTQGSFFFTYKIGPQRRATDYFVNFDLLRLIRNHALPPPATVNTSSVCPHRPLNKCPKPSESVDWDWFCQTWGQPTKAELLAAERAAKKLATEEAHSSYLLMLLFVGLLAALFVLGRDQNQGDAKGKRKELNVNQPPAEAAQLQMPAPYGTLSYGTDI
uniref:glucan 1,3-beta-glucosidase n=1 Tax=Eutreptiella gymnastica TaxID=73025 RepID=A0A7S1J9Y6_9EUGL|mmetsp:Transcript_78087/g.137804  ORF Transcript_78087/g.137804 Transcript_78087/m.137804 type:complete len:519 (+) Transcript_78087:61-1617(+)